MNAKSVLPTVYLVALDAAPTAQHVLEVACQLSGALGGAAELHLVHVMPVAPPPTASAIGALVPSSDLVEAGRAILDKASALAASCFGGRISGYLGIGDAAREITQLASNISADLVVVGTGGKTGLKRLALGSVSEKVVRLAGCPVLVVRAKDHHTAVVPEIQPPCPDCVAVQNKTSRAKLWCTRHETHHVHGRLHYEVPEAFAKGTMLLRPE